ncbi:BREX-2 system phosphatase PglZ [Thiocapsa rosea]|uniref:PglZ domain-containing protein n=1 Tax=Thiocapsa rosea TaxID=69360 RepID=A0A495VFR1_9GAMM|nr:BREX-2 system phosphatase PglZ [Thiocapsa rosea]RKT46658.1 PglZ domain-containing protein [Thiocapsa rosea]
MAEDPVSDHAVLPSAVLTQVQAILSKDAGADRIALVWPEPIEPRELRRQLSDTTLRVVYCPSELAIRELLVTHAPGAERLVMLSPFDETRLSKDVLARLWGCEPKRISPWRTLEQLLRVRRIDPRLTGKPYRWIAEALVDAYDRYRGRIQFGEVLDVDQAWRALALARLDFAGEALDLDALLDWSRGSQVDAAVSALPEPMVAHLGDWLALRLGASTELVLSLWREGHAGDMVAIGLVCSVLYRDGLSPDQALFQARGRLRERVVGGARIEDTTLQDYGRATVGYLERFLAERPYRALDAPLTQAQQLLASLDMRPLAVASDLLPDGFGLRLDRFAQTLDAALAGKPIEPVLVALADLRRHQLAKVRTEQLGTAELTVRACRWLRKEEVERGSLAEEVGDYVGSGGYLDWARSRLWSGDAHEALNRVYRQLIGQVSARRERLNERFSHHLPAIARGDQVNGSVLPVERALDVLIAPLAKQQPVLVLVLDGMSHAVYRELAGDLLHDGWVELQPADSTGPCCLLAALPTITRISRYALLSGTLGEGTGADEKKAFAAHPGLKTLSSTKFPPRLFHKGDLLQPGSGALAEGVREVIAGQAHKVVGAVINAVDDQLSSGAQVSVRWSVASIGVLRRILEAARESRRLVILTSDHGHVLDHDMTLVQTAAEAERFKPLSEPVGVGEVRVSGERVVLPGNQVILPWSERIRYTAKKMGYHGGGSLQEVLIPFGVYRNAGETGPIEGWREVARQEPDWWVIEPVAEPVAEPMTTSAGDAVPTSSAGPSKPSKPSKSSKQDAHTLDLFAELPTPSPESEPAPDPVRAGEGDWIAALMVSPVYAQMKARSARVMVSEAQLRQLLDLLSRAGGQQMAAAVAQGLGLPEIRLYGLLAGVQKLLNVDGYPVLAIDRVSKTIRLDLASLKTQFEL